MKTILFLVLFLVSVCSVANPLGDCSSELSLTLRNDVVMCEPWEDPLWWEKHKYVDSSRKALSCDSVNDSTKKQICFDTQTHPAVGSSKVVSEVAPGIPCISGKCLKVTIPQGDLGNFSAKWLFKENTGSSPERMYLRYYVRVSDDWDPATCSSGDEGGKLFGLSHTKSSADPGGQCGNGGNTPDDTADGDNQCWSMRTMHKGCVDGGKNVCTNVSGATWQYGSYLYFPRQYTFTGSNGLWHNGLNHWSSTGGSGGTCNTNPNNVACGLGNGGMLRPGKWYAVEMMVFMNSPGQSNGVIRGWVDGALSYEKTNMVFRLDGHDEIHVREAWLNVYMGGTKGSCNDIEFYFDQMVMATDSKIGLISANQDLTPPLSPTNLKVE